MSFNLSLKNSQAVRLIRFYNERQSILRSKIMELQEELMENQELLDALLIITQGKADSEKASLPIFGSNGTAVPEYSNSWTWLSKALFILRRERRPMTTADI